MKSWIKQNRKIITIRQIKKPKMKYYYFNSMEELSKKFKALNAKRANNYHLKLR